MDVEEDCTSRIRLRISESGWIQAPKLQCSISKVNAQATIGGSSLVTAHNVSKILLHRKGCLQIAWAAKHPLMRSGELIMVNHSFSLNGSHKMLNILADVWITLHRSIQLAMSVYRSQHQQLTWTQLPWNTAKPCCWLCDEFTGCDPSFSTTCPLEPNRSVAEIFRHTVFGHRFSRVETYLSKVL